MPTSFGPNIVIDGSSLDPHHGHPATHGHHPQLSREAQDYESSVKDELVRILMFRTGHAVIHEIWERLHHHSLRIVSWTHPGFNAWTTPTNYPAAVTAGQPLHVPDAHGVLHPSGGHGTGHGSDVVIEYSPSISASDITLYFLGRNWQVLWLVNNNVAPLAPGNESGELLLHEMAHALSFMLGQGTGLRPELRNNNWDTEDEVRAIIVTNIYSSERGRPLRDTHRFGVLLQGSWSGSAWFRTRLDRFNVALPALVALLRPIDTPFNPFRGNYGITDAMH